MKILVSDFDHTFYTLEYEKNIEAIKKFVANGNMFIIATGRNLHQLLNDLVGYEIPVSYYICNDGAVIFDKQFQLLYRKDIEPNAVEEVFHYLDESKYFNEVLIDDGNDYLLDPNSVANKIIARPTESGKSQKQFEKLLEAVPKITGYFSQNWLNIVDKEVNKGKGIELLQLKNDWRIDDIYTVGDSINDLTMNTMYRGYAMENGEERLKRVSIGTVSNIREVIEIIEKEK